MLSFEDIRREASAAGYTFWDPSVAWLDPGESTGWAMWFRPNPHRKIDTQGFFMSDEGQRHEVLSLFNDITIEAERKLYIGWESFNPAADVDHDYSALKTIGCLEWMVHERRNTFAAAVPSSSRRAGMVALKSLGWHKRGKTHANDAAGHLLTQLMANQWLPVELVNAIAKGVFGHDHS